MHRLVSIHLQPLAWISLQKLVKMKQTRMHSSRKCTPRFLTISRSSWRVDLPNPLDADLPLCSPPAPGGRQAESLSIPPETDPLERPPLDADPLDADFP